MYEQILAMEDSFKNIEKEVHFGVDCLQAEFSLKDASVFNMVYFYCMHKSPCSYFFLSKGKGKIYGFAQV